MLAHWHWRTDRAALRQLALARLPAFDRWADHRDPAGGGLRLDAAHVNAATPDGDGRLLVRLGLIRPQPRALWHAVRERGCASPGAPRVRCARERRDPRLGATPLARSGRLHRW